MNDYPLMPSKPPRKDKLLIIKVSEAEKEAVRKNAERFTGGNVSQWIRKASISYAPETLEECG